MDTRHTHENLLKHGGKEASEVKKFGDLDLGMLKLSLSLISPKDNQLNLLRCLCSFLFQRFSSAGQLRSHPAFLQHRHQTILRLAAQPAASQNVFDQVHRQFSRQMDKPT